MSRQNMDAFLEPFERESGIVENDVQNDEMQQSKEKDENETETEHMTENKFGGSNNPYDSKINNVVGNNSPKHSGNCIDDPDFMFIKIPGKNCDWVSQNSRKVCNMLYKGQLVRDFCKVACNNCINKGEKEDTKNIINNIGCDDQAENCDDNTNTSIDDSLEDEENKTSPGQDRGDGNNDDKDQQPTIIDDNDVFCEDLSQYQKWYEAKVTKADGVKFRIVKEYKHDENAFTQGLTYHKGKFYESDGLYGKSAVRIVDQDNADAIKNVQMANEYFAEGLTVYKDTLVQLTWKSKRGFVYNITSLEEIYNFTFSTERNEGWGITWDRCKDELIVTDGSANIYFWDPKTMKEKRRISIKRLDSRNAKSMNEIEFWRGRILANVWYEDVILVINPETGVIEKEYEFSELWPKSKRSSKKADVFNGISISADPNVLYVTGKLWDRMFSIELLPDL